MFLEPCARQDQGLTTTDLLSTLLTDHHEDGVPVSRLIHVSSDLFQLARKRVRLRTSLRYGSPGPATTSIAGITPVIKTETAPFLLLLVSAPKVVLLIVRPDLRRSLPA